MSHTIIFYKLSSARATCQETHYLTFVKPNTITQCLTLHPPLIEGTVLGVSLERALLDDEPHLLKEAGCGSWRLSLKQDVDGLGHGVAQLVAGAVWTLTTFRILAVSEPV